MYRTSRSIVCDQKKSLVCLEQYSQKMGYLFEAIGSLKGIMTRDKTEMRSGTVRKCACKPTHGEIGLICAIRRGRNVFEISGTAGRWKSTICDQVDTAGRSKSVHLPTVSDIQIHFNLF